MAITRKPKVSSAGVDVEALINRGGSTPPSQAPLPKSGATAVVVRIPDDMLQKIDAAVQARPLRIPRHTWLLEAILEKLSRETTS